MRILITARFAEPPRVSFGEKNRGDEDDDEGEDESKTGNQGNFRLFCEFHKVYCPPRSVINQLGEILEKGKAGIEPLFPLTAQPSE